MSDTTPETSVTPTPTVTTTVTPSTPWYKTAYHVLGTIFVSLSVLFAIATFVFVIYLKHNCESFWNEKCTVVAVPTSISDQFSEKFYKQYNADNQPSSATTAPTPAKATSTKK